MMFEHPHSQPRRQPRCKNHHIRRAPVEPLSARVFRLRIARGYSVYELASTADVVASTIQRLEAAKPVDKRCLAPLARALGVRLCQLVCGEHNCVERACVLAADLAAGKLSREALQVNAKSERTSVRWLGTISSALMKHRHLEDAAGLSPAAIDDILDRGNPTDWASLWRLVEADPFGPVASDVLRICAAHPMYGTSRLWPAMIGLAREDARAR